MTTQANFRGSSAETVALARPLDEFLICSLEERHIGALETLIERTYRKLTFTRQQYQIKYLQYLNLKLKFDNKLCWEVGQEGDEEDAIH